MSVYVIGHRNPDTDAICSALAYADLLSRTTHPDAVAACCGPPNKRTEFVLERTGLKSPRLIMDVRPTIADICRTSRINARPDDVFHDVYARLKTHSIRTLPVVDDQDKLFGLLSLIDMVDVILGDDSDPLETRTVDTTLTSICRVIGGTMPNGRDTEEQIRLIVTVGAMGAEGFKERLDMYPSERMLIVSGNRPTIQLPAIEDQVRALIVTGGYALSPGLLQMAKANNVTVIYSPHDTATTTMLIRAARRVAPAIKTNIVSLAPSMALEDATEIIEQVDQTLFPVVDDEKLVGVIAKSDLIHPPRTRLVLVDHNELDQAVRGAEDAEILQVLDHHRLGGSLKTTEPIRFVNEPVGSTCTLVAGMYRARGIDPSPEMALCMASGIISDTLHLRSPTATDVDRVALEWLETFTQDRFTEYAAEFFAIGSALRTCAASDVISEDCKEFEESGVRFSISQIEETGFDLFWDRRQDLHQSLGELASQKRLDFSCLLITDIQTNSSLLLMSADLPFLEAVHYPRLDQHLYQLDGVVSRKKQLLPLMAHLLHGGAHNATVSASHPPTGTESTRRVDSDQPANPPSPPRESA